MMHFTNIKAVSMEKKPEATDNPHFEKNGVFYISPFFGRFELLLHKMDKQGFCNCPFLKWSYRSGF